MTIEQEKIIIQKVVGGDANAFEDLVLANQKNIYNLALKMTRNKEDALDVSQEAFIKAYRQLADFHGDSLFSVWLYKITYNLCIDFLRKNAGAKTLSLDVEDDAGDIIPAEIPDVRNLPEDSALRGELRKSLADGINELSPKHRDVLIMHEITGMSYKDISETLGISFGTVQSRLSRARLKLMKILEKKGTIPESYRLKIQEGGFQDE